MTHLVSGDTLSQTIWDLELPYALRDRLNFNGLWTVASLAMTSPARLRQLGFRPVSVEKISTCLASLGLRLASDPKD